MRWIALVALIVSSTVSAGQQGPASAADTSTAASNTDGLRAVSPQAYASHRAMAVSSEDGVQRLTRTLDLDAKQQERLRELLQAQRRDVRKLWDNPALSGDQRVGATLEILERTRNDIRAMLNEEQRKKYPAPIPRDATAPAHADTDYWLRMMGPGAERSPGPGRTDPADKSK